MNKMLLTFGVLSACLAITNSDAMQTRIKSPNDTAWNTFTKKSHNTRLWQEAAQWVRSAKKNKWNDAEQALIDRTKTIKKASQELESLMMKNDSMNDQAIDDIHSKIIATDNVCYNSDFYASFPIRVKSSTENPDVSVYDQDASYAQYFARTGVHYDIGWKYTRAISIFGEKVRYFKKFVEKKRMQEYKDGLAKLTI